MEPMQAPWVRLVGRFWNKLVSNPNWLAHEALVDNFRISSGGRIDGFWCTNVLRIMQCLGQHVDHDCLQTNKFGEQQLQGALNSFHDQVWWPVRYLSSPTVIQGAGSRLAAYYQWFCDERTGVHRPDALSGTRTFAAHIAAHDICPSKFKTLMRFRLGCWHLRVNTGRFDRTPREQRLCTRCSLGEIEDEEHVLLRCSRYNTARAAYAELFRGEGPTVSNVMNHSSQKLVAALVHQIYRLRFQ